VAVPRRTVAQGLHGCKAARLLDVLAAFESRPGELSVKDIAAAAQLPVSTTYRIVNDLVDWAGSSASPRDATGRPSGSAASPGTHPGRSSRQLPVEMTADRLSARRSPGAAAISALVYGWAGRR
jgi:hypothetical protein